MSLTLRQKNPTPAEVQKIELLTRVDYWSEHKLNLLHWLLLVSVANCKHSELEQPDIITYTLA